MVNLDIVSCKLMTSGFIVAEGMPIWLDISMAVAVAAGKPDLTVRIKVEGLGNVGTILLKGGGIWFDALSKFA